jgi:uncharacterized protein (DUF2147 family)
MRTVPPGAARRAGFAFAAAILIGSAVSCGTRDQKQPAPTSPPATAAPAAPAVAGFERLTGRWLRPDGGYILEIRSVSPEGRADASYFNPRTIRVGRAEASREGETLSLLVELSDVNYPGSIYRLVYDPARDILAGTYFQAVQQQTFEVFFVRR